MWGGASTGATSSGMGAFMMSVNDQRKQRAARWDSAATAQCTAGQSLPCDCSYTATEESSFINRLPRYTA